MRRPASTALLAYGRDLNVAKLTQALNDVDDELEWLRAERIGFLDRLADHYWDSLEPNKALVLKHIQDCINP